jgi:hypothetical protein
MTSTRAFVSASDPWRKTNQAKNPKTANRAITPKPYPPLAEDQ